jgi:hypothetical protein
MVKKQRTSKAEATDVRMLYEKASQYKRAMEVARVKRFFDWAEDRMPK